MSYAAESWRAHAGVIARPHAERARAKLVVDVVVTLALLPFVALTVLLLALAVKIDSPGPVFCSELRMGANGRRFSLWRLRTTRHHGHTSAQLTQPGELRVLNAITQQSQITRVGRVLLKTHLDHLPQLINVLRGEMSLVGPRPTRCDASAYPLWYTERLEIKPGITGLAQISNAHEPGVDETVRLDIAYIRTRTIRLDAEILLRSVGVMIGGVHEAFRPPFDATPHRYPAGPVVDTEPAPPARAQPSLAELGARALVLGDIAAAGVALYAAYTLRFVFEVGGRQLAAVPPSVEYVKLFVLLSATTAVIASFQELYRTDSPYTGLEETYAVAKAVTLATGVGLAIAFFYRAFEYSRLTLAYFWLFAIVLIAVTHSLFRKWLIARYARGVDLRRTIVVGNPSAHLLERLRSEPAFGVALVGWIGTPDDATDQPDVGFSRAGMLLRSAKMQNSTPFSILPRLGSIEDTARVIGRSNVRRVIIIEYGLTHAQLLETIDACERNHVDVHLVPPVYDLLIEPTDLAFVNGIPTLRIDEARFHRSQQAVKRIFDIVVSSILLLLLGPALVGIAIAIRRTSRGPALFRQQRAGRNGLPFEMLKFRTMVCDAEQRLASIIDIDGLAQPVFKLANDPRVTPLGRWLRRFSLDELPQLLNVLKGDMTLVGPRPEELKIVQRYDIWQRRRLKMKPGITGLQQVVARGALSDLTERVRLDMYYTRKQSFLLDLVILGRTVGAVMSGRGAS